MADTEVANRVSEVAVDGVEVFETFQMKKTKSASCSVMTMWWNILRRKFIIDDIFLVVRIDGEFQNNSNEDWASESIVWHTLCNFFFFNEYCEAGKIGSTVIILVTDGVDF